MAKALEAAAQPAPPAIRSGEAVLTATRTAPGQIGIRVSCPGGDHHTIVFEQAAPLEIEVIDAAGAAHWQKEGYQTVTLAAGELRCSGLLSTHAGTRFLFADTYHALPGAGGFVLNRQVRIESPGPADKGFSSRFSLAPERNTGMADYDFFAPGIWYGQNQHVPPTALASDPNDHFFFFREDRLPLPLMMLRERRSGSTLALAHLGSVPTTFAGEDGLSRIIDARLQFGSIGIVNDGHPVPPFLFPGSEGERTYIYGSSTQRGRWALRSHPVKVGVPHAYRLLIRVGHTPDFPSAVSENWRAVYALQPPPMIRADLSKVYRDGMELLETYCHRYNGVISMPFAVNVPDGTVKDTSSQMGFVGQALPAAALLLRYALETHNAGAAANASDVVDFWAVESMTPSGAPRTWYDITPDGHFTWRNYPTFLRVASDGMDGALQAWMVMREHGDPKPAWLAFCRRYGDWLTQVQNRDGSFARSYGFDGKPRDLTTDTTDHPIRFLVDLYRATGILAYRQAAIQAGEYCWKSVHQAYAYIGGTPDNPNVMDKEGGMMAVEAFLALYDVTGEEKWLQAAAQAGRYSETWVYCWNIPMPEGDPRLVFPPGRTTYGLSLIAAGHSGCDTYMASAPFLYYRLYLFTGDEHFLTIARMLLHDTKQLLDWDGTLGYAHPGLQTEALSLVPPRGHGVRVWLPWLTVAQLEPLVRLHDVFGSMDIDRIEALPRAERLRRNRQFGATRGY